MPYKQIPRQGYIRRCSRFKNTYSPVAPKLVGKKRYTSGKWSYGGSKPDRIHFTVSKPVTLHGVQHFGSRDGEYTVSTEVKDSTNGSILVNQSGSYLSVKADTDSYYGFDVEFDRPVSLLENKEYELVSLIKGPLSWFGEEGQKTVDIQGVQFTFRSPDYTTIHNGTNDKSGQFPAFLIS